MDSLGQYIFKKLLIDHQKSKDINMLSKFCTTLTPQEAEYWYTNVHAHEEYMEEEENIEEDLNNNVSISQALITTLSKICSAQELKRLNDIVQIT